MHPRRPHRTSAAMHLAGYSVMLTGWRTNCTRDFFNTAMDFSTNEWTQLGKNRVYSIVWGSGEMRDLSEPNPSLRSSRNFAVGIRNCRALRELNDSSKRLTGLQLIVLIRTGNSVVELHPAEGEYALPLFCQAYRSTPQGLQKCRTCRSLIAFGACYRGLIEFACHGGLSVIAAPAIRHDGSRSKCAVLVACAFTHQSRERGWDCVRRHATEPGMNLNTLRKGYDRLPVVSHESLRVSREICGIGAVLLGELEERLLIEHEDYEKSNQYGASSPVWPDLAAARDPSFKPEHGSIGSPLVDYVIAMVAHDPTMPHSVSAIARDAHVTPNHFSMLFKKHTGLTFREYLSKQRIHHSCELLHDVRLSVAQVAIRAGFRDPAYFSRRFREVMGTSPTNWRLEHTAARALPTADRWV